MYQNGKLVGGSKSRLLMGAAAVLTLSSGGSAWAQDNPGDSYNNDDIVVTAQRRSQSLQDVALAVSAFDENLINRGDLDSVDKLEGAVPSLNVSSSTDRTNVSIRGIGANIATAASESGVALNIDGVYQTRTTLGGAVFGDLQQIEVLRGPQGTLYGRNATGGAVNVWTKVPDGETSGEVSALIGNGDRYRVRGAVSMPLGENLSARIGAEYEDIGGLVDNLALGSKADFEEHLSGRAVVRWAPTDAFELILRGNVSDDTVGGPRVQFTRVDDFNGTVNPLATFAYAIFPPMAPPQFPTISPAGQTSNGFSSVYDNVGSRYKFKDTVLSASASYDMGWATLNSVTAYQKHDMDGLADLDGTSAETARSITPETSNAFTQEITLGGSTDKLDWVVGGFYMEDSLDNDVNIQLIFQPVPGPPFPVFTSVFALYDMDTTSLALFGQGTYSLTDNLRLTAGLRYTEEDKTIAQDISGFSPAVNGTGVDKVSYNDLSPKFGIDFDASDNVMLYASATKGFKAGGVNVLEYGNNAENAFDPEELWAYEAGLKSDWFDNRLQVNLNYYVYDYKGFQASRVIGLNLKTDNAADAELSGLEAEVTFKPLDGLTFKTNLAWQDSEFGEFLTEPFFGALVEGGVNLEGNELAFSPSFAGNVSAAYEFAVGDGDMVLSVDHSFSGEYFLEQHNLRELMEDGYGKTNARVSYSFGGGSLDGIELSAFVNNIQDESVAVIGRGGDIQAGLLRAFGSQRTYGAEMRYRF